MSSVPHRLIDLINPDEEFSLAQYQKAAYQTISDIQHRGKIPLLVGGSGLYVWAVVEGWQIPEVCPGYGLPAEPGAESAGRRRWRRSAPGIDAGRPLAAGRIDPRNVRRVIRASRGLSSHGCPYFHAFRTRRLPLLMC
jgi:tRNA dimethylallyltransferase